MLIAVRILYSRNRCRIVRINVSTGILLVFISFYFSLFSCSIVYSYFLFICSNIQIFIYLFIYFVTYRFSSFSSGDVLIHLFTYSYFYFFFFNLLPFENYTRGNSLFSFFSSSNVILVNKSVQRGVLSGLNVMVLYISRKMKKNFLANRLV